MEEVYLTATEAPGELTRRGDIRSPETAYDPDRDIYEIVGSENAWRVVYGSEASMDYVTKEAAFEAAVAAAANAIRGGHDVTIHVAGAPPGEASLGGASQ